MASMTKPIEITASRATTRRMTCRFGDFRSPFVSVVRGCAENGFVNDLVGLISQLV
jgi:hypothetical protein